MTASPVTAVVTLAYGRHDHLDRQLASLARSVVRPDLYLVVAIDDPAITSSTRDGLHREVLPVGSGERGLPLAAARNAGVGAALAAGADVVVLLDVDCLAAPDLVGAYAEVVTAEPATIWSGPVTYLPPPGADGYDLGDLARLDDPHPARPRLTPGETRTGAAPELFWSLSFAVSAAAWRRSGGFCEEYAGYGGEDTDFARVALHAGLSLGWVGAARAYHQHHEVESPPVRHLEDILRNGRIFHRRWGSWPMTGWLEGFERLGLVERHGEDWVRTS